MHCVTPVSLARRSVYSLISNCNQSGATKSLMALKCLLTNIWPLLSFNHYVIPYCWNEEFSCDDMIQNESTISQLLKSRSSDPQQALERFEIILVRRHTLLAQTTASDNIKYAMKARSHKKLNIQEAYVTRMLTDWSPITYLWVFSFFFDETNMFVKRQEEGMFMSVYVFLILFPYVQVQSVQCFRQTYSIDSGLVIIMLRYLDLIETQQTFVLSINESVQIIIHSTSL